MQKMLAMGVLLCCFLFVFTASSHAQLIKKINFSAAEGYTDGLLVGQPASGAEKWTAASTAQGEEVFNVKDEAMFVHPDGTSVIWIYIPFPAQKKNIVTVTWDWQYFGPPEMNMDLGFTFTDTVNFMIDGDPMTVFNEQCTPCRMGDLVDARNGNDFAGGGTWVSDNGVPYRDGVKVYMRMVADNTEWTFDVFARREGEAEVQVADDFLYRRAPSIETDGVNAISLWLNGGKPETSVVLDNIVITGPEPVDVDQWDLY